MSTAQPRRAVGESLTPRPPSGSIRVAGPRSARSAAAESGRMRTRGGTAGRGRATAQAPAASADTKSAARGGALLASALGGDSGLRGSAKASSARGAALASAQGDQPQNAFLAPFRSAVRSSLREAKRRGRRAFNAGKYGESARWFSQALMLGESAPDMAPMVGDQVSLLLHRASAWSRLGNHHQAVEDSELALSLQPNSPRALLKKGKALLQLQQYADASEAFITALERNPGNEDVRRGFYDSIRGLRLGWHQYCPSFTHNGSGPYSTPAAEGGAGGGVGGSKMRGVAAERRNPINACDGVADKEVAAVLERVGGLCDLAPLLSSEVQAYRAIRVTLEPSAERDGLMGVVTEYRDLLMQLFSKYCEQSWSGAASRVGSKAHAGHLRPLKGGREKLLPASKKRMMTENQFWQFCVDCGLVTRTFNRRAVALVWRESLECVQEVTPPAADSAQPVASFTVPVYGAVPPPKRPRGHARRTRGGPFDYEAAHTLTTAFPGAFRSPALPATKQVHTPALEPAGQPAHADGVAAPGPESAVGDGASSAPDGATPTGGQESATEPVPTRPPGPRSGALASRRPSAARSTVSSVPAAAKHSRHPGTAAALFPKFIEALIRLCTARYRPKPPPPGTRVRLVGARRPTAQDEQSRRTRLTNMGAPESVRGGGGGGGATSGAATESEFVVSGIARRVKYALDTHLLSNALLSALGVDGAGVDATGGSHAAAASAERAAWGPAQEIMSMYRSRLRKIFFFFAASDSGAHRHMDVREFLYMLKVLGITDHRNLPLEEAARVVVTWAGFIGDPNKHKLDFGMFCDVLARCADVKTHDGVMPIAARLDNFLVSEFFQRIRSKTDIASLWL